MNEPQIVIVRKQKKLHRGAHLLAFVLTAGASAPISAAAAASNAAYNAETERLVTGRRKPSIWRIGKI